MVKLNYSMRNKEFEVFSQTKCQITLAMLGAQLINIAHFKYLLAVFTYFLLWKKLNKKHIFNIMLLVCIIMVSENNVPVKSEKLFSLSNVCTSMKQLWNVSVLQRRNLYLHSIAYDHNFNIRYKFSISPVNLK